MLKPSDGRNGTAPGGVGSADAVPDASGRLEASPTTSTGREPPAKEAAPTKKGKGGRATARLAINRKAKGDGATEINVGLDVIRAGGVSKVTCAATLRHDREGGRMPLRPLRSLEARWERKVVLGDVHVACALTPSASPDAPRPFRVALRAGFGHRG